MNKRSYYRNKIGVNFMSKNEKEGYIYVYKCIVGSRSDVVKIGMTKHYNDESDRLKQHGRTLYYGFVPYTNFFTGQPISTAFLVRERKTADKLIKKEFAENQFTNIEVYNIEYQDAIKRIYDILNEKSQFIKLIEDTYTDYNFLDKKEENITEDEIKGRFKKKDFINLRDALLSKYHNNLPEEIIQMLRNRKEFEENCNSHFKLKNWIDFGKDMILDINFNSERRQEIYNKLKKYDK